MPDGVHLPGQTTFDVHDRGIDFLRGSDSTYPRCGPTGTGVLHARNRVISRTTAAIAGIPAGHVHAMTTLTANMS
ncbi:hypothetical protein [Micromonospora schwarzwaldensis]|uniref:hypothetical protein n=1 Tax=Micromonospora sp. DSM 45708 TaxID=3111767 RepID=UPI0031D1440C